MINKAADTLKCSKMIIAIKLYSCSCQLFNSPLCLFILKMSLLIFNIYEHVFLKTLDQMHHFWTTFPTGVGGGVTLKIKARFHYAMIYMYNGEAYVGLDIGTLRYY